MMVRNHVIETPLLGLLVVESTRFVDSRGYFMETYSKRDYAALGIDVDFVQDNQSKSLAGTLRGLHFQREHPQAKLVRVLRGRVFDVGVDLRKESATFGKWYGLVLDASHPRQFFLPAGFAHGFLALTDDVVFSYKCSDYYCADDECGLIWNDPDIGIEWPLRDPDDSSLSAKDRVWPRLKDLTF